MKKVILIVQARNGSTRMPGKVTTTLIDGKSLLECLIERLKRSKHATEIMIATSDLPGDNGVAAIARAEGVLWFRGSEGDVLSRFVGAVATEEDSQSILVRICADSPLHDAEVIDKCVEAYSEKRRLLDYVSNMHPESYPYGMAVEVFSHDVLLRLDRMTLRMDQREHVTSVVYKQPSLFASANVDCGEDLSACRFAVDYPEDFAFVKAVYERLYRADPGFSWRDVITLLKEHPELLNINEMHNERLQRLSSRT